jgi:hypothetical protein
MSEVYSKNKITEGEPVYNGKQLVGYIFNDPTSNGGKRFYPLKNLIEIINKKTQEVNNRYANHSEIDNTIGSGGSRKRARRNSKKHKRVRHSRRKQTRRHRHSRRR